MTVRMDVDYVNIGAQVHSEENCELAEEEPGAPIVNVDANFLIPDEEQGKDLSFFRMEQMHKIVEDAIARGKLPDAKPWDGNVPEARPFRRPDHLAEWGKLQRAWSLLSRGNVQLSENIVRKTVRPLYPSANIETLPEWLWYFAQGLIGTGYSDSAVKVLESLRLVTPEPLQIQLAAWALEPTVKPRGALLFDICVEFFAAYDEFAQVIFHVQRDFPIDTSHKTTSVAFDRVRMFYGNAFETFTTLSELLSVLNNVQHGRAYNQFERLTWDQYRKLDKPALLGPFSKNQPLSRLAEEADGRLRNASHHRRLRFDPDRQLVSYSKGKGESGADVNMPYSEYLIKCVKIFFQIMSVGLIEIALTRNSGRSFPA